MQMSTAPFASPLDDERLAALASRPLFRAACERSAAEGVAHYLALSEPHRWICKDLGRFGVAITALILHFTPDGLTAHGLTTQCRALGIASSGRVARALRILQDHGELTLEPGHETWTRRRLVPSRGFLDMMRERAVIEARSAAMIAPECAALVDSLNADRGFGAFVLVCALIVGTRPDLLAAPNASAQIFLQREAGMLIMLDLVRHQPANRTHLLETATISRKALAQRFDVSRAHINKILADAAHAGLLRQFSTDTIVFAPTGSAAISRVYAAVYRMMVAAVEVMAPVVREDASVATSK
jgi:hypothetical protein